MYRLIFYSLIEAIISLELSEYDVNEGDTIEVCAVITIVGGLEIDIDVLFIAVPGDKTGKKYVCTHY